VYWIDGTFKCYNPLPVDSIVWQNNTVIVGIKINRETFSREFIYKKMGWEIAVVS